MNFLEKTGITFIVIAVIHFAFKAYNYCFGYKESNCPNDHDTMARQGAKYCNKCKNEI